MYKRIEAKTPRIGVATVSVHVVPHAPTTSETKVRKTVVPKVQVMRPFTKIQVLIPKEYKSTNET